MALDFGKLNFSVSFNPTSAFPLDARSYFESYDAAVIAAAGAVPAGSSNSTYYYGQTLVIVEDNKASFYIIQPNGTLSAVTGSNGSTSITVNPKLFEYDDSNNLSLIGFNEAEVGMFFTKDTNGTLTWTKPIDAYTKEETDTKIATAIAAASKMKRKIVASVDEIENYMNNNSDAEQYIFMVPTGLEESGNKYNEYMVIVITDNDNITTQFIEKVGSWEVDLNGYAKISDVNAALAKKVDIVAGQRLMTEIEGSKLVNIEEGAQVNLINSISTDFTIDLSNNKQLNLNNIAIAKVTGLQEILNRKVDAKEGHILLSPTDKKKLDSLTFDTSGDLTISGTINANKIQGLDTWIENRADSLKGLSENNFTDELYEKLMNNLFISSVDTTQLSVSTEGKLSVIAVDSSKVTGLQEALNSKVNQLDYDNTVSELNKSISSITALMNNYVLTSKHEADIQELWEVLTWKEL